MQYADSSLIIHAMVIKIEATIKDDTVVKLPCHESYQLPQNPCIIPRIKLAFAGLHPTVSIL